MRSIVLFFFLISVSIAQPLSGERAEKFVYAIINKSDSLEIFVLPEELTISKRLGITYEGFKNKFLISYEIASEIRDAIKNDSVKFSISIERIDHQFSILHFECPAMNYRTKYYFKNGYLISPSYFIYKDWQRIESEYFIFYISEPMIFNQYSINRLENFLQNIFQILKYTDKEINLLRKEKLIYILCKDEAEIESLTGYKARGMFNLAYDYIITTFNCHYHELLHLLINFKLKEIPIFTHSFFQEGFAAAIGGRGGKEPEVILNLGCFLTQSGFLDYKDLLDLSNFKSVDPSMSYPLSGLYNKFLVDKMGIDNYLNLYLKYSTDNFKSGKILLDDLPNEAEWQQFINTQGCFKSLNIDYSKNSYKILSSNNYYQFSENEELYLVKTKGDILISGVELQQNYISNIVEEFYPQIKYNGEKYLVRVNENEISVYNLYTNNLIANYASGFSLDMKLVPTEDEFYTFSINKNLFDETFEEWIITHIEK